MAVEDFDGDRRARREAILGGQLLVRLFEQIARILRQRAGLFRRGLDQKRAAHRIVEVLHRIEQVERVLGPEVERVAGKGALQLGAAFCNFAHTEQLNAQLCVRAPEVRRQLDGAAVKLDGFIVAAIDDGKVRQGVEELAGLRVDR